MEVIWGDSKVSVVFFGVEGGEVAGFDLEFAPEGIDVFLVVGHAGVLHHMIPCCRVGTVGADEEVEVHFDLDGPHMDRLWLDIRREVDVWIQPCLSILLEPRNPSIEVRASELVIEVEGHIRQLFQCVEQSFVQA